MDRDLIENKLESLRKCIARIETKIPDTSSLLRDDYDLQDIIVLNLERAVQNCVDVALHILSSAEELNVPDSMVESFRALERGKIIDKECAQRMAKSVGFRNIAVHAYQEIDYEIVYSIITRHLNDFRVYASQILHYMRQRK